MKKNLQKSIGIALGNLFLLVLAVQKALGAGINDFKSDVFKPDNLPGASTTPGGVELRISEILQYAINLILYASGSLAVLFLVLGGIRYITSLGNQEAMDHAKKIVKYALAGLLAVILSYAAVTNLISLVYRAAG